MKRNVEVIEENNDWWNIPATADAEYDEYDYFYTKVPQNTREWNTWGYKCQSCGKYHRLNVVYTNYFLTLDGYDSMSYEECWVCTMQGVWRKHIRKFKKKWKVLKETIDLKMEFKNHSWKKCYKIAKIEEGLHD